MLTELLPNASFRERITAANKLRSVLATVVVRDPRKWGTYNIQPLTFVHSPDSPLYADLADAIPANLDYIISAQQNDGGWGLTWSWENVDPMAWKAAKKEWRGVVTLEDLERLDSFRRIAH